MPVKVGVVGYGTIGKRVVDALLRQDDMILEGIVKRSFNYETFAAKSKGVPIYAADDASLKKLEENSVKAKGTMVDLLEKVDVVIDATSAGMGVQNSGVYRKMGVKAVFQGGEAPDVAEVSFNSLCNYREALGKRSVRVVSCNTTGLLRLVCSLNRYLKVRRVKALIIRRGADTKDPKSGPINSVLLKPLEPSSHHGRDAMLVARNIEFRTRAVVVPTTLMHIHYVSMKLGETVDKNDVLELLREAPRTILLNGKSLGVSSTGQLFELFRDLGRERGDIPELIVWEESVEVDGDELSLIQAVHQESIVVPENVDAVRAVSGIEHDAFTSIRKTDESLKLIKSL